MRSLVSCLFAALLVCSASVATAQDDEPFDPISVADECEVDADCEDDEICRVASVEVDCAPCVEDPDGEPDCPPCDEGGFTYGECVPPPAPPCESDADCAADDVCVTFTYEACTGGGFDATPPCLPDEECEPRPDPIDDVECTESTDSVCVPPYLAPCELDSDCGPGFTCEEMEVCSCSSDGAPRDSTEDDDPQPAPECSCEPLGEFYCELERVECDSDADCDPDLFCTSASRDEPTIGAPDCDEEENCGDVLLPEPEDESYCAPEGYLSWGGGVGSAPERLADSAGVDSQDFQSSDRVNWGDGAAGSGGKSDTGGCSAAGGAPGSILGLLMLAGLLLRRRN